MELQQIQNQITRQCTDILLLLENKALQNLEKWSNVEKSVLKQKSRARAKLTDQTAIKEEIIGFYKSLKGAAAHTLPAVSKATMRRGPVLNQLQGIHLCKDITNDEIHDALFSIGDDKSPGVDSYNVCFYKKSRGLIKEDIQKAIKEFFTTGVMHRAINCTILTLVPKTAAPSLANYQLYYPLQNHSKDLDC
ncbi:uncharacterized protein LOC132047756 [Lycium ferocissimum]|uniref:uncharacterized protein LOC132047756 n=1 Tax=Lycium ferocissimum TaxID=112874 RepID=UPI002814CD20|nr:uncharacterized protein LOC132047756 [Lycium ferocissimum]